MAGEAEGEETTTGGKEMEREGQGVDERRDGVLCMYGRREGREYKRQERRRKEGERRGSSLEGKAKGEGTGKERGGTTEN